MVGTTTSDPSPGETTVQEICNSTWRMRRSRTFLCFSGLSEMAVHLCPGWYWDWKEKIRNCYRIHSVTQVPETDSTNPQNTSAKYQHNIPVKNSWISSPSTMSEKPHTIMCVVATTFTMFLLLLLTSHIIHPLWTAEPGKEQKEVNLCQVSQCRRPVWDWIQGMPFPYNRMNDFISLNL